LEELISLKRDNRRLKEEISRLLKKVEKLSKAPPPPPLLSPPRTRSGKRRVVEEEEDEELPLTTNVEAEPSTSRMEVDAEKRERFPAMRPPIQESLSG
jgi:hypothetical protein